MTGKMKKHIIAACVLLLFLCFIFVMRYGFHFRDMERDNHYHISGELQDYEVAEAVMEEYFLFYKTHGGLETRLSDYRIKEIEICDIQDDGFVFKLYYDLKPLCKALYINAGNGDFSDDGWIVSKAGFYKITGGNKIYTLEFVGTDYSSDSCP